MPELPEVESIRKGLQSRLINSEIHRVVVRNAKLRWKVSSDFSYKSIGNKITDISRRSKYLVFHLHKPSAVKFPLFMVCHMGMSGSIRLQTSSSSENTLKHDHIVIELMTAKGAKLFLHYNDPRRFGFWQIVDNLFTYERFINLGPEPLSKKFNSAYLNKKLFNRTLAIKNAIMNASIVVGVGNIYASEALFLAKIYPLAAANSLNKNQLTNLCKSIKQVLKASIAEGGVTLKDFSHPNGEPGYYKVSLKVYGKEGQKCSSNCGGKIKKLLVGNRASYYCPVCQKPANQ